MVAMLRAVLPRRLGLLKAAGACPPTNGSGKPPENWALQDVSLEVRRGTTLGVVGVQGAGKSTLLRILAGTMRPTTGWGSICGRVAAVLDAGQGPYNRRLSVRDNIVLAAAGAGLGKRWFRENYEPIIAYAGLGNSVETPLAYISIQFYLRLAWSMAVRLRPDILLIDDCLAASTDPQFAAEVARDLQEFRERGTTLVMVSADTAQVEACCQNAIWMSAGQIAAQGPAAEVVAQYVEQRRKSGVGIGPELAGKLAKQAPTLPSKAALISVAARVGAAEARRWYWIRWVEEGWSTYMYVSDTIIEKVSRMGARAVPAVPPWAAEESGEPDDGNPWAPQAGSNWHPPGTRALGPGTEERTDDPADDDHP